jgi:hypothetical protein
MASKNRQAPSLPQHSSVSEWDETAVNSALADLKVLRNPFLRIKLSVRAPIARIVSDFSF